jgi:hypothetical protein
MCLLVDNVPVIRESHLSLVKPGWTHWYLNQDDLAPKVSDVTPTSATASYEAKEASATFSYHLLPNDVMQVALHIQPKVAEPTEIEYAAGFLNANLLQGQHFEADTVEGRIVGAAPVNPMTADEWKAALCPLLKSIAFDTALGRMRIRVEASRPETGAFRLFDSRLLQRDWAQRNHMFWFGLGAVAAPAGDTITVTYAFDRPAPVKPDAVRPSGQPVSLPAAERPWTPDTPIIPHPKELREVGKAVRLAPGSLIVIPDRPAPEELQAAREVQAELKDVWGLGIRIARYREALRRRSASGATIYLARREAAPTGNPFLAAPPGGPPAQREGYSLMAGGKRVCVLAASPRGVYNGAQTVKQLIRVDPNGGIYMKPATIRDWPTLAMRGVHWYGGPQSWPFHRGMIARIAAPLKMNAMLFECSFTEWESQPRIWSKALSTSKASVRRTVDFARAHFLEPIPLVETLGHCDWIFQNGQNRDLVADPDTERAYAYDPDKPRVYSDVIFPVLQETIDLFHPKIIHLGRDEVRMWAKFPPKGSPKTTAQLYLEDLDRLHSWLKARGIQTMVWGDQFLHSPTDTADNAWAEDADMAKRLRSETPKDVILNDWHYQASPPEFPSVDVLQKAGFGVVGASWYEPANIQNFARALAGRRALGLIETTWDGWSMSENAVSGGGRAQYVAYVLAAEFAWTGGNPGLNALGYDASEVFRTLWDRKRVDRVTHPGFAMDVQGNGAMWSWLAGKRSAKAGSWAADRRSLAGTTFQIGRPLILRGALEGRNRPALASFALGGRKAKALHLLLGATRVAQGGSVVATLAIRYADGRCAQVPLAYGRQVFSFLDSRAGSETATVWRGKDANGAAASVRRWTWANPRPTSPIASLTLTSAIGEAAPVLLAVTGVS